MKLFKKLLILISIVVILIVLAFTAESLKAKRMQASESQPTVEIAPWSVRVRTVTRGSVHSTYRTLGTVESIAEVQVAGRFPGAILEVGPREGQRVEIGTLLARIDTEEFDAGVAAKEAELNAVQEESARLTRELERENSLFVSGGSTQSKVDAMSSAATTAQKKVTALKKSLDAMRTRRSYARVTSPVAGVIKSRLCEVGDLCSAYHPIFMIDADGAARLTLDLPQALGKSVETGTRVTLADGTQTMDATLTRIHPELSSLALITADADLTSLPFGLHSGSRIEAKLELEVASDTLVVPLTALFGSGQERRIARVTKELGEARVELLNVSVQLIGDEGVAVTSLGAKPLKAGDLVVLGRPEELAKLRAEDPLLVVGDEE